ncbi:MAG TPA: peptidase E [Mycobacteriales bacterium]|nr:peptidase E [Mycobacteriales bacterium]
MTDRHIVAMGGFGLSLERPALLDFALGLTGRDRPSVCFVPTASADRDEATTGFYRAISGKGDGRDLPLFARTVQDLRAFVLDHDVVYVAGGNTANALAVWRAHGLDAVLREAWESGVVMCGASAGANCWFQASSTDSFGPDLAPLHDGLGFLAGGFCPHYDGEVRRRPRLHEFVAAGFPDCYAADNFSATHFVGTELAEAIASNDGATVYRVTGGPDGVQEEALPTRLLR